MKSNLVRPLSRKARAAAAPPQENPNPCIPDARRGHLEQAFVDFYNCLFDSACDASDEQKHTYYLRLLRETKAREHAIIDSVCADAGMWTSRDETSTPGRLKDAVMRRCETLPMDARERALLESALEQHLLSDRQGARGSSRIPNADPKSRRDGARGGSPVHGDGEHADVARVVARLRAGGLELPEFDAPGAAAERSHAQAARDPARPSRKTAIARISATILVGGLCLLGLSPLYDEGVGLVASAPTLPPAQHSTPVSANADMPAPTASAKEPHPAAPEADAPPPIAALMPAPETRPPVELAPAETATAAADERIGIQVQYLLRRGDAALGRLQLTEPYADSAAANYAAVLVIDPDNAAARQGLEQIIAAYVRLARDALSRGNTAYALELLARGRSVGAATPELEQLEREIGGGSNVDR